MSNVRASGQADRAPQPGFGMPFVFDPVARRAGGPAPGGSPPMSAEIHPVDQIVPTPRLLALGLEDVLVMYAGSVAVPLIIGRALKLPPEEVAFLISAYL